eukprot:731657-Amphidinium_carterae.1
MSGKELPADALTKVFQKSKLQEGREALGLQPMSVSDTCTRNTSNLSELVEPDSEAASHVRAHECVLCLWSLWFKELSSKHQLDLGVSQLPQLLQPQTKHVMSKYEEEPDFGGETETD